MVVMVLVVSGWSVRLCRSARTCASVRQASSVLPIEVTCAGTREPTRNSRLTVHWLVNNAGFGTSGRFDRLSLFLKPKEA